ncbi:MAG: PEP-CTERM sorting domain-containing protein [Opitutaceae bacterium]
MSYGQTVFSQNFSAGGITSDYTGPANSSDTALFTNIATTGSGSASISSNALLFQRTASSSGGFRAVRGNSSNTLSSAPLSAVSFTFDMNLNLSAYPGSALNTGIVFGLGQAGSTAYSANATNPASIDSWLTFSVKLPSSGSTYTIRNAAGTDGTTLNFGTNYTVTVIANTTGSILNYMAPSGSMSSVAATSFDIWVGTSIYLDDVGATNSALSISAFKINHTSTSSTLAFTAAFDNISVAAIPEPSTYAALAGLAVLGLVAYRRKTRLGR